MGGQPVAEAPASTAAPAAGAAPAAAGKKPGFLESLFGSGFGKKKPAVKPELEEEVEELFEQMEPEAEPKPRKGGKKDQQVATPATGQTAEGMTYHERRRLEREGKPPLTGQPVAGGPAPSEGLPPGLPVGSPAGSPAGSQRLTRRQQRLAEREKQPGTAQAVGPQSGGAQPAAESPGELAGLDVGDLLSTGKKKKKGKAAAESVDDLDEEDLSGEELGGEEGEGSLDELAGEEDLGGEEGEDLESLGGEELLTQPCPHCRRQAKDIAYCPNCGSGLCEQCAPERVKLLDQVKWTCPKCRAQFKVKAKAGKG